MSSKKRDNLEICPESEPVNTDRNIPELLNKRTKISSTNKSTPYAHNVQYEQLQQKFQNMQQFHLELLIQQKYQQIQKLQLQLIQLQQSPQYENKILDANNNAFTKFISNNLQKVLLGSKYNLTTPSNLNNLTNPSNQHNNSINPVYLSEHNHDELIKKYHTYSKKLSNLLIEYKKNVVLCNEAWNSLMITSTLDYNFHIFIEKFDIIKTASQIIPELANQCVNYIQMIKQIREIIQSDNLKFASPLNPMIFDSTSIVQQLNELEQFRSK
jgi:hypothetical protein